MIVLPPLELRPDPDPARDWMRNELAKPEYQESLLQRAVHWFWDQFGKLIDAAGSVGRLNPLLALGLLALVLVGLAFVLARLRPEPRSRAAERAVLDDSRTTAAQYRARADQAMVQERWDDAVVDGMRAVAVGLVERALVDDLPSATAHEVADAATAVFPTEQARLRTAARLFDDVRYGDRHATKDATTDLLDLEGSLRALRPEARNGATATMAVPR